MSDKEDISEINEMPLKDSEMNELAIPEPIWKKRIAVNPATGKLALSHEDSIEAWREFSAEWMKEKIMANKIQGNRNSGAAKMNLFQRFIEGDSRTETDFKMICIEMDYNPETSERYWQEYQYIFGTKFKEFLLKIKFNEKVKKKDSGILEF